MTNSNLQINDPITAEEVTYVACITTVCGGETIYMSQADAQSQQSARYASDPWDGVISRFIGSRNEVTVTEVLRDCLHLEMSRWGQPEQNRVARSLKAMQWERKQRRSGDEREWCYRRPVTETDGDDGVWDNVTALRVVTGE